LMVASPSFMNRVNEMKGMKGTPQTPTTETPTAPTTTAPTAPTTTTTTTAKPATTTTTTPTPSPAPSQAPKAPKLKALFRDARLFYRIIDSMSLIDEGVLKADENGLKLKALDSSKVVLIDFEMPRDAFDEYYCEGELNLGLNIEELRKVAKRGSAREKVLISAGEGRFRLTLKGKADRSFTIPLIDLEAEELPEPQVELKARAGALADVFESALKDVELVSDFVKITADGKTLVLRGASDSFQFSLREIQPTTPKPNGRITSRKETEEGCNLLDRTCTATL